MATGQSVRGLRVSSRTFGDPCNFLTGYLADGVKVDGHSEDVEQHADPGDEIEYLRYVSLRGAGGSELHTP